MFKIKGMHTSTNRSRLLLKNAIGTLGVKGGLMVTSLLMVPLMIDYVSKEQYGIWITLYSIIQWTAFFDIGFGNGLKNKLTIALAEKKTEKSRYYVSTTYFFMLCIFSFVGVLGFILIPHIQWNKLFNTLPTYQGMMINVMKILALAFSLQMILNTLTNVLYAYQLNALSASLNLLAQIISLLLLYILSITVSPSLENIALIYGFAPVLIYIFSSCFFYSKRLKAVAPSFKYINFKYAKDILTLGGNFFIIQFAFIIVYQTVNIIISRTSGPVYVAQYNIAYQYLSVPMMLFSVFLSPLWPAITDAHAKNDYTWMIGIYNKMKKIFLFSLVAITIMVLISPYVYAFWIGKNTHIEFYLTVSVAIYMIINIWNSFHSAILNGMGKVRIQLLFSILGMILIIPTALYLGKTWGVYGIMFSIIGLSVPTAIVSSMQVTKLLKCKAKGYWDK